MNKINVLKIYSKTLYFIIFNVLCILYVNANFVNNEQILLNTLRDGHNKIHSFKMSADHNLHTTMNQKPEEHHNTTLSFNRMIMSLLDDSLNLTYFELMPGVFVLKNNETHESTTDARSHNEKLNVLHNLIKFAESHVIRVPLSSSREGTERLFFFKGLKKLMWPIMVGIQMVKLTLFAIFLPSIIGSVGKIVSKGLTQVSGFSNHGQKDVDDLEFRDNYENTQTNENEYTYPAGDAEPATANSFISQMYKAPNRFAQLDEQNINYLGNSFNRQSVADNKGTSSKNVNFQVFQDIPNSSLLLTNYDPFYSPLLSRLDAVFQQLSLPADSESCREKLICLMYTNPAKYAPYSNLVSAQLSRELNELKKPTSDNPDILRFFKYMKAAKDGQDRSNCDALHRCSSLKDTTNPTMLNTFNDINKLVEARNIKQI